MSTRADFYQGRGQAAVYLGSIGHDAVVESLAEYFEGVTTFEQFQAQLACVFMDFGEIPAANGWPWPWDDSETTGTVIAFDGGQVWTNHHTRRWSPLRDYDKPTDLICRYPNMGAQLKSTPHGRLAAKLRFKGGVTGPAEKVLINATSVAMRVLTADWMHVFNHKGELCHLSGLQGAQRSYTLTSMAEGFQEAGADFDFALLALKGGQADSAWDLLDWIREHVEQGSAPEIYIDAQPDVTPMYFARPTPAAHVMDGVRTYRFNLVRGGSMAARGLVLWNRVLDAVPSIFVQEVTRYLFDMGSLPIPREELEAWMRQPHARLNGATLAELSATFEGRERVRDFAHEMLFRL